MTRTGYMLFAAAGSLLVLLGAFGFQWLGYLPCKMCLWQRWPHAVAIGVGAVALFGASRILALIGALAMLTTAIIGAYHTGVERKWWEGPTSCTGGGLGDLDGADLLSMDAPGIIMCDEVAWQFLSLSMASWNVLISLVLMWLWITAFRRPA